MKYIKLANCDKLAVVDNDFIYDMAMVHNENWWAKIINKKIVGVYTSSKICKVRSRNCKLRPASIALANVAMGKYTVIFDHKDRNSLNNLSNNLRECVHIQNCWNRSSNNINKFRGVTSRHNGWFRAKIMKDGKYIDLGSYKSIEEAARAYDKAAIELHSEFANLNFPDSTSNN